MINLYIDFDGVIMNTIEESYDDFEKFGIDKTNKEEVSKYYRELDWKDFLNNRCSQINDSINCIQKLIDSNLFNINILSHINSLDEAIEKIKYIRKYFNDITFIPVPKKISKTKMVHTKDAILVDDYSENLREWEKALGIGIRFSEKLNGKGFYAINRLDQVIDYVKKNMQVKN